MLSISSRVVEECLYGLHRLPACRHHALREQGQHLVVIRVAEATYLLIANHIQRPRSVDLSIRRGLVNENRWGLHPNRPTSVENDHGPKGVDSFSVFHGVSRER